jgi:hypothetical protein
MHAVVICTYTKSIQVIPVKWVLNFDRKNIEKKPKVCYYNNNLEKNQNPIEKGLAERRRRRVV